MNSEDKSLTLDKWFHGKQGEVSYHIIGRLVCAGTVLNAVQVDAAVAGAQFIVSPGLNPSGGLAKIKAMAAPYVNMKFMPTGGINAKNLITYLDFSKIIACGGSWMVPGDLINAGEWDKIEQLIRETVQTMLGFELAHVGVNAENEEEAMKVANRR